MELSLTEKKKIVPKGKKLDPLKIKYISEKILGPKFRKILAKELNVSEALITHAFKGRAPFCLYRISELLKRKSL